MSGSCTSKRDEIMFDQPNQHLGPGVSLGVGVYKTTRSEEYEQAIRKYFDHPNEQEGTGGSFDYWPDGLDGPMLSEQPPFGNVALISDNDQLYHRIGAIGNGDEEMHGSRHPLRSSRMAMALGPFLRVEKSAPPTQAMRFGFRFSGRPKSGRESRGPAI